MKKSIIVVGVLVLFFVGGIFAITANKNNPPTGNGVLGITGTTIYKGSTCGCCSLYTDYFKNKGDKEVSVIDVPDISVIKEKYNVPSQLQSCHTTVIGDYFIEGHIPMEAISKLLTEKPAIAGIAMPGMPSGSPGMPGSKTGPFVIYAVNKDGTYNEFMTM